MVNGVINYDLVSLAANPTPVLSETSKSFSYESRKEFFDFLLSDAGRKVKTAKNFSMSSDSIEAVVWNENFDGSEAAQGLTLKSFRTMRYASLSRRGLEAVDDFIKNNLQEILPNRPITFKDFNFTLNPFQRFKYMQAVFSAISAGWSPNNPSSESFVTSTVVANSEQFRHLTFSVSLMSPATPQEAEPENEDKVKENVESQRQADSSTPSSSNSVPTELRNLGTKDPLPNVPRENQSAALTSPRVSLLGQQSTSDLDYAAYMNKRLSNVRAGAFSIAYLNRATKLKTQFDFSLLPAIDTTMRPPGASGSSAGVPEVKPGILIRTNMNHKKFGIPGAGPIYQNLGIDQMVMQVVGTIVGNETVRTSSAPGSENSDLLINSTESLGNEQSLTGSGSSATAFGSRSEALYHATDSPNSFLNSYLSCMQFNNLIVTTGREVELLIIGRMSDKSDDILKIRFRGFVEGIRFFVARSDRAYYAIDFIITKFGFNNEERTQLGLPKEGPQAVIPAPPKVPLPQDTRVGPVDTRTNNAIPPPPNVPLPQDTRVTTPTVPVGSPGFVDPRTLPSNSGLPILQNGSPEPGPTVLNGIATSDPNGLNRRITSNTNFSTFDPALLSSLPGLNVGASYFDPKELNVLGNFRKNKGSFLGELSSVLNSKFSFNLPPDFNLESPEVISINGFGGPISLNTSSVISNSIPPAVSPTAERTESLDLTNLVAKYESPFVLPNTISVFDGKGNQYNIDPNSDAESLQVIPQSKDYAITTSGVKLKNGETISVQPIPAFQKRQISRTPPSVYKTRVLS